MGPLTPQPVVLCQAALGSKMAEAQGLGRARMELPEALTGDGRGIMKVIAEDTGKGQNTGCRVEGGRLQNEAEGV